jgi:hypothetical protein
MNDDPIVREPFVTFVLLRYVRERELGMYDERELSLHEREVDDQFFEDREQLRIHRLT